MFRGHLIVTLAATVTWIILTYMYVIFTGFHPSDTGELLMNVLFLCLCFMFYVYVYVLFDITIQNTLQITHNK